MESSEFHVLSASMPTKCTFRSQTRLFGTQRNSLYKCNHLGGVLEAQARKSAVFTKKSWNSPQQLKFRQNMFCCKIQDIRENARKSQNVLPFVL